MTVTQLIRCPACGATNRVPGEKVDEGLQPVCGRCKAPLPGPEPPPGAAPDGKPLVVTDATFGAEVAGASLPVVVDMWAPWCGPCRAIAPIIDELAAEMAGRFLFAKMNVDENPATASRFHVASIPTLLVLKNGHEIDRIVGVQPKPQIAERLERVAP